MADLSYHYDPDRVVRSFHVGSDRSGSLVIVKFSLRTGAAETVHFQRETALWLYDRLQGAISSGRLVDRRLRRGAAGEDEPLVVEFLRAQPDLLHEDWDNCHGARTAAGIEFHEFSDGIGLVVTNRRLGRQSYTLPDQACQYLAGYLREIEPMLRATEVRKSITLDDIDQRTQAFQDYLEDVDARLRREGVAIHRRPLLAFRELARDGIQILIPSRLAKAVTDWFDARYGAKLAIDFSIGKSIAIIRGDPYVMRFPLILGQFDGIFDTTQILEGFTKELFAALTDDERTALVNLFVGQYEDFQFIDLLPKDLCSDLDVAVLEIVGRNPHYGVSKWSSLQFVEKVLKACITKGGRKPERTHDLRDLVSEASRHGRCPAVPDHLLRNIQCQPGVRYGEERVNLAQAVGALHAAIRVGRILCPALTDEKPFTTRLR
jgi:hypothetical protein